MKNSTLILLGLLGVGVYLYLKNKNKSNASFYPTAPNPAAPVNDTGVPPNITSTGEELPQTLDAKGMYIDQYNVRFSLNGVKKIGKIPNTI